MSIIDQLIKVKKKTKNEDILDVLDELTKYEKLSKLISFENKSQHASIQKKLPFLWKASQHDIYAQTLLTTAGHICAHLTGETPEIVDVLLGDLEGAYQRRLELMQTNSTHIAYRELIEYDHDEMADNIIGIYSEKREENTSIIIIVEQDSGYIIFQGYYTEQDTQYKSNEIPYYEKTKNNHKISIQTYSLQGNNTYPFAQLYFDNKSFTICIPDNQHIKIDEISTESENTSNVITLTQEQQNKIALSLTHIETFADTLLDIICQEETV